MKDLTPSPFRLKIVVSPLFHPTDGREMSK